MTAPPIDRERLRALLGKLPSEAKRAAVDYFTSTSTKTLADESWTQEGLAKLVEDLVPLLEDAGYVNFMAPIDTAPLKERIDELPDDLATKAAMECKPHQVPNVVYPDKWTVAHWEIADRAITKAEADAASRRRSVMAALGSIEPAPDDNVRHELVKEVTHGRTESSKKLTGPEARHLTAWADGQSMRFTGDGPGGYMPDWKAEAKRLGTTQAKLLKDAKMLANEIRATAPKALGDITDHTLIALLLDQVTEDAPAAPHTDVAPENAPEGSMLEAAQRRMKIDADEALARQMRAEEKEKATEAERIEAMKRAVLVSESAKAEFERKESTIENYHEALTVAFEAPLDLGGALVNAMRELEEAEEMVIRLRREVHKLTIAVAVGVQRLTEGDEV